MEWKMSRRFTSPFPPLALAPEDAGELEALARVFVSESVSNYERFLFDDHAQVDERRWKFMYEKENVRSYAERRRNRDGRHDSNADDIPIHSASSSADLPIVMVTGTIEGDLDDTIFGFVCPTLDMMRIKTAYIKDGLYRGCVLASLIQPSVDDPFRSLSIKWVEKGNPIHIRAVVKNRDFVYMESTGVEYLRNGERVGYQLVHSVQFPQTPELGTSIRGNMSMSAVYRQKDHQVVEVFLKGFLNPAGGLMRSIITRSAAKALLSVSQNVYCAQMKKLAWTIRQHRNRTCRSDTASSTGGVIADHDEMWCKMCAKKKTSLLPGGKRKKRRTCRLCGNYVCSKCRIDHKLHFMLSDRRMVQQSMAFCASCLHLALDAKTLPIARHELMFNDLYEWSEPRAGSSGTEISLVDYLN